MTILPRKMNRLLIELYEQNRGDISKVQGALEEKGMGVSASYLRSRCNRMGLKAVLLKTRYMADIIAVHLSSQGNVAEAQRQLAEKEVYISRPTIRDCWLQEGLKFMPHGGRRVALNGGQGALSDDEIAKVIKDYDTFDGCVHCAGEEGEYSRLTYKKYWGINGLPTKQHNKHKDSLEGRL